jgi:hypothetical protein
MKRQHIHTLREANILSAGMYRGMRNVAMARAADKSQPKAIRALYVKHAREHHHVYLARLREASGEPGYRVPVEIIAADVVKAEPTYSVGAFFKRQAS